MPRAETDSRACSNDPQFHERCVRLALERAERLCRRRGARLTALRRRVLELVWQSHRAVKAYDVLNQLGRAGKAAKPPTVYRALDFLMAHGLVHRVDSLNAFVGCARPGAAHSAQFLICDDCGDVREMDAPSINRAVKRRADEVGFHLAHRIIVSMVLANR